MDTCAAYRRVFPSGHAAAGEAVFDVIEAVGVLLALLQAVDHLDELALHRQLLRRLGVALGVEVGLHRTALAVEEEGVGLDALAAFLLPGLRPHPARGAGGVRL